MLVLKAVKSVFTVLIWEMKYGSSVKIGFPQAMEKVTLEKDRAATVVLGEKIQNRGAFYLGCKGQGRLSIGAHCFFNTNTSITCMKEIVIGDYCKFGNNLVIVDHDHDFRETGEEFPGEKIEIGDHVWVGAGCTILKGVKIGDHAVIGAGSVVRRDVPAGSVYYDKREAVIL